MLKKTENQGIWVDKYGNKIPIKKMSDFHLMCTIRALERYTRDREKRNKGRYLAILDSGNISIKKRMDIEKELVRLETEGLSVENEFPGYADLCIEAERRGLL